jgi:hypothetical protein
MWADDIPAVAVLKRRVFGPARTDEAMLRHLYIEHAWGTIRGVLAEQDGRLVAAICGASRPFQVGDEVVVSRQAAEVMVAPDVRGRLLFRRLMRYGHEGVRSGGGAFAYGFPNRVAEPHLRFIPQERLVLTMPLYLRALDPGALRKFLPRGILRAPGALGLKLASLMPSGATSGRETALGPSPPGDLDDLWQRQSALAACQTVRNLEYYRWRYEDAPAPYRFLTLRQHGALDSCGVLAPVEYRGVKGLALADWVLDSTGSFGALLSATVRAAQTDGAAFVVLATLPRFAAAAIRLGFFPVPERYAPSQLHLWMWLVDEEWPGRHLLNSPRNWFVTLGDTDLV